MSIFTRQDGINLLIEAFPLLPLPGRLPEGFYSSDLTDHFIVFKDQIWKDVDINNINLFSGFTNTKYLLPEQYYFYYLPSILVSVLEDTDFMDVACEALLPNTSDFKINQKWKIFISYLNLKQIKVLIIFFEKLIASTISSEKMKAELLISMLEDYHNSTDNVKNKLYNL